MSAARARGDDISRSRMDARTPVMSITFHQCFQEKENVIERGMCAIPQSQL